MKRTIEQYYCDICNKGPVSQNALTHVDIPVRFTTEQLEGRPCTPHIVQKQFDLCDDCLDKAVTISAAGAMGYNTYTLGDVTSPTRKD